ncbi:MAG: rod shape-determining protein MreD [Prevotellaceae bacterium]|jgi:rod shape-determining protein MreD|nr:rod shape-determining protein MreD [Prevotellaceae bacterium]
MKNYLSIVWDFLLLGALQVLFFNQVHLFGAGSVFIYVLFVLRLPLQISSTGVMLLSAMMGVFIDVFSQSFGLHTAAIVLIAYLRPSILRMFFSPEEREKYAPTYGLVGANFFKYAVLMILIHHITLFMLEAFSFKYMVSVLIKTLTSSLLTFLFVFVLEIIKRKNIRQW